MDERSTGLLIVVIGLIAVAFGLLFMAGAFSWVGRLPGDIRYTSGSTRISIPIPTMLLLSAGISVVACIARRLF